jgi:hypothetical protein
VAEKANLSSGLEFPESLLQKWTCRLRARARAGPRDETRGANIPIGTLEHPERDHGVRLGAVRHKPANPVEFPVTDLPR